MLWPILLGGILMAEEAAIPVRAFQPIPVGVVQLKDLGSQGIVLPEEQFTHLLFEKIDTTRFRLIFVPNTQALPKDVRLVISGTYRLINGKITCQCTLTDRVMNQQKRLTMQNAQFPEVQQALLDTLQQYSLSLIVTSDPPGGTVTVNGIPAGTTPVEIQNLPADTYRIQVELQNARKETTVVLTQFQILNLKLEKTAPPPPTQQTAQQQKAPKAKLYTSKDLVCEVWIDGKKVGNTTQSPFEITPGKHTVRCVHPFYGTKEWVIEVKPGEEIHLNFEE